MPYYVHTYMFINMTVLRIYARLSGVKREEARMFYEVLMEKRAEKEERRARKGLSPLQAAGALAVAGGGVIGGQYATHKGLQHSDALRNLVYSGIDRNASGKSRLKLVEMTNKLKNRKENALLAGGLLGGGLGVYGIAKYEDRNK